MQPSQATQYVQSGTTQGLVKWTHDPMQMGQLYVCAHQLHNLPAVHQALVVHYFDCTYT